MTCDQMQPLLEAFADGELGWGTGWRVRRHLAACPACASELAELRQLSARVRAWRDVPAPAGLQGRLAVALPSAPPVSLPRHPALARRAAVGLAGLAAAAVAFSLLPGQPSRPTIALADVEQAMQQVKTVSYKFNFISYDASGKVSGDAPAQDWLRRTPPAIARHYQKFSEWDLDDERGQLSYNPQKNTYLKHPAMPDFKQQVGRQIRRLTEPPSNTDAPLGNVHLTMTPWRRSKAIWNGQNCWKFDQTVSRPSVDSWGMSIWVDPKTLHIVRIEAPHYSLTGRLLYLAVFSDFQYNQTPPPNVFDWSPPSSARPYNLKHDRASGRRSH